ncbi:MAG: hypothetical protein MI865_06705 [Proteobacteria bacterium]|nr:hypothetical protein [Pseudomonadota bacterium]
MDNNKLETIWGLLRIAMGWLFFWTFIDKTFGLGFATTAEKAWIAGGSPTAGFLTHATKGPLADLYQAMAGNALIDCLYMSGLLLIGLALMLGIGVRIAGYAGAVLMIMIYTAGFMPPKHNPFMDHHIIYIILLAGFAMTRAGHCLGFGKHWSELALVKKFRFLE